MGPGDRRAPSAALLTDVVLHQHPKVPPTCAAVGVLPAGPPLGQARGSGLSPW